MNKWGSGFLRASCVAFLPLALVYGGGFPVRQGLVLGLLLASLMLLMSKAASKPVPFIPHWVRVSPNWFQILTDFRLIASPEEWRSIAESVKSTAGHCVLRDGVLFTVVQQSEDFERTVIFWNQRQAFGSEFSFSEDMTPIQFEQTTEPNPTGWLTPPPRFFMRSSGVKGVPGYRFGIEVRDWWWAKVQDSCNAPLGVDTNPLTGSVEVTLAALPLREFDIYRDPADRWTDEYIAKTEPQIRKRRDEARQKLGWADKTSPREPGFPQHIEHRYLNIEHREI